jgi:hypothetical protein
MDTTGQVHSTHKLALNCLVDGSFPREKRALSLLHTDSVGLAESLS